MQTWTLLDEWKESDPPWILIFTMLGGVAILFLQMSLVPKAWAFLLLTALPAMWFTAFILTTVFWLAYKAIWYEASPLVSIVVGIALLDFGTTLAASVLILSVMQDEVLRLVLMGLVLDLMTGGLAFALLGASFYVLPRVAGKRSCEASTTTATTSG